MRFGTAPVRPPLLLLSFRFELSPSRVQIEPSPDAGGRGTMKALCLRRLWLAVPISGLLIVALVVMRSRSPLRVGGTAKEAWTYLHTAQPPGTFFTIFRRNAHADTHAIQVHTEYLVHTPRGPSHEFAEGDIDYLLDTNGNIVGIKSHWQWLNPFYPPKPVASTMGLALYQTTNDVALQQILADYGLPVSVVSTNVAVHKHLRRSLP